jgi:hypothetical protein
MDDLDIRVGRRHSVEELRAGIGRAVVDKHDLVSIASQRLSQQTIEARLEVLARIEDWNNDGYVNWHDTVILGRRAVVKNAKP